MPNRMASTALPTISRAGASSTKNQASSATARHSSTRVPFSAKYSSLSLLDLSFCLPRPAAGLSGISGRCASAGLLIVPHRPAPRNPPPGPAGHFLPLPRGTWPHPRRMPSPSRMCSSRRRIWAFMGPSSMVIAQQMEHRMDRQIAQLPLHTVAVLLRLGGGPLQRCTYPPGAPARCPVLVLFPRLLPGERSNMGKESTSVGRSTPACPDSPDGCPRRR